MSTVKERRRTPRSPSKVFCDIYDSRGRAVVGEGRCIDFSTLGVRMVSRKSLKAKSAIRLQVVPSDKPVLEIPGKVIWARKKPSGFEYGIQFS